LEAGVYHFGPHDHALRRLRRGDYRGVVVSATAAEPATAAAPAVLVCTSTFWRNSWKYRARTYRHCFWDCGTLLANVLAVAHALALPARVVLGFADAPINRLLDLDTAREVALVLLPLGRGAIVSPDDRPLEPLGLPVRPLSSAEVDYPEIRRIHDASCLSVGEVAAWRARTPAARSEPALHALPRAPRSGLPVDRAILRRSSTRRFAREALSLSALTTMLDAATRGIPTDYTDGDRLALGGLYLIANAVDGLSPGAYAFDHRRGTMEPLREGPLRRDAGHLALGQELAEEASVNVYVLTGLEPVLARYGNRGYRAAQLEGGIVGGKLYLAAAALGTGATGLTFFDDDVTAFFSPHARDKSVMFLMAVGVPQRLRRARSRG
jgi:SagB-type dehydrogenase family enzyme